MRKDLFKVALTFMTVFICITTALRYLNNGDSFNGENIMAKPVFTDNLSESYNRLKQDLKDKYAELIYKIVDKIKTEIVKETSEIFSEETLDKIEEAERLKTEINAEKQEFYSQEKYRSLQDKLVELKDELSKQNKENADKTTSEMQVTLDKISTLNITIKNRTKEKADKLYGLNNFIEGEFDKNRDALKKIKDRFFEQIKREIIECLDDYNDELAVLNDTFGKETDEPEMPFDDAQVRVEIPIFSYLNETADIGDTYIISENDNPIKN